MRARRRHREPGTRGLHAPRETPDDGAVYTQAPATQRCPSAQARPHAPQCARSDVVSTQPSTVPGHRVRNPQSGKHRPASHHAPMPPHERPQAPQLLTS